MSEVYRQPKKSAEDKLPEISDCAFFSIERELPRDLFVCRIALSLSLCSRLIDPNSLDK